MITVFLNRTRVQLAEDKSSVAAALDSWPHATGKFVVAVNGQLLQRTQYENTFLQQGDRVEILQPMQGG